MRAPTSYAGPRQSEKKHDATFSQTEKTNISTKEATVETLLAEKGNDVFSVQPDELMLKAVSLLREKRIGALVVTSPDGALEGILSERDIVRKLAETPGQVLQQKVEMLMTRKVQVCSPKDSLIQVLRRMTENRFRHMPVVSGDKLIGLVTIGDVVHHRLNQLEHESVQLKQMIVG
ncbi:MAG: CBS domain-containing protein [Pseudomonadota bacterium]